MIKTFADSDTRLLFEDGESKKLPANLIRRALRKLEYIDNAEDILDLRLPPGNRLHAIKGQTGKGSFSISIKDQWCSVFALRQKVSTMSKFATTIK